MNRLTIDKRLPPEIVQTSSYASPFLINHIPFVLSSSPTNSSILLAFTHANQFGNGGVPRDTTPPDASWTNIDTLKYDLIGMDVWWKKVNSGDGVNYTFNISGGTEYCSGVIYEVKNCNTTTPIDQHNIVGGPLSTINPTPSVTPTKINTLAIAGICATGGSLSLTTPTVSTGWVIDKSAIPPYISTFTSHRILLTSDTTTPISNTFTFTANSFSTATSIVLLAPV